MEAQSRTLIAGAAKVSWSRERAMVTAKPKVFMMNRLLSMPGGKN
jgi:hypothetical protein